MEIRKLNSEETPPYALLLLADPSKEMIASYIDRGDCFIAEKGKHIIGVYVLLPTKAETIELMNVSVAEQQQGSGIGKRLVVDAIRVAKEKGYKTIEVCTGNSSIGQLALYQKCGFRITRVDRDYFTKHYVEVIVENGIVCRDRIRLSQDL